MKVFALTVEQQAEEKKLASAIKAASAPLQAAQLEYRKFVASVTGGTQFQRSQVTDDGATLVIQ